MVKKIILFLVLAFGMNHSYSQICCSQTSDLQFLWDDIYFKHPLRTDDCSSAPIPLTDPCNGVCDDETAPQNPDCYYFVFEVFSDCPNSPAIHVWNPSTTISLGNSPCAFNLPIPRGALVDVVITFYEECSLCNIDAGMDVNSRAVYQHQIRTEFKIEKDQVVARVQPSFFLNYKEIVSEIPNYPQGSCN